MSVGILGGGQDGDELFLGQFLQCRDHRQASNEFGDESVAEQILRFHMLKGFAALVHGIYLLFLRAETEHMIAESPLDHFVQIDKSAAANEQDVAGVDTDVFLLRMFAPSLRRHSADGAFQDLE